MINKETILSNYNDRLTLLQWLKKVELALQNASAKEFRVNKLGNATLTFSIVFDDDTELTTGPIVLEQGESVTGATITDGHLLLTLTNGDVLDAGDVGAVTSFSIDASQHLIVTYQDGTTQDLGAIFQGNVNIAGDFTADSIIENMAGYSWATNPSLNAGITIIYAGCVKNGNKITFAVFMSINLDTASTSGEVIGTFSIPLEVANKIYPFQFGGAGSNYVDVKKVAAASAGDSVIDVTTRFIKNNQNFTLNVLKTGLLANVEYFTRYEVTFLLNDNLAS